MKYDKWTKQTQKKNRSKKYIFTIVGTAILFLILKVLSFKIHVEKELKDTNIIKKIYSLLNLEEFLIPEKKEETCFHFQNQIGKEPLFSFQENGLSQQQSNKTEEDKKNWLKRKEKELLELKIEVKHNQGNNDFIIYAHTHNKNWNSFVTQKTKAIFPGERIVFSGKIKKTCQLEIGNLGAPANKAESIEILSIKNKKYKKEETYKIPLKNKLQTIKIPCNPKSENEIEFYWPETADGILLLTGFINSEETDPILWINFDTLDKEKSIHLSKTEKMLCFKENKQQCFKRLKIWSSQTKRNKKIKSPLENLDSSEENELSSLFEKEHFFEEKSENHLLTFLKEEGYETNFISIGPKNFEKEDTKKAQEKGFQKVFKLIRKKELENTTALNFQKTKSKKFFFVNFEDMPEIEKTLDNIQNIEDLFNILFNKKSKKQEYWQQADAAIAAWVQKLSTGSEIIVHIEQTEKEDKTDVALPTLDKETSIGLITGSSPTKKLTPVNSQELPTNKTHGLLWIKTKKAVNNDKTFKQDKDLLFFFKNKKNEDKEHYILNSYISLMETKETTDQNRNEWKIFPNPYLKGAFNKENHLLSLPPEWIEHLKDTEKNPLSRLALPYRGFYLFRPKILSKNKLKIEINNESKKFFCSSSEEDSTYISNNKEEQIIEVKPTNGKDLLLFCIYNKSQSIKWNITLGNTPLTPDKLILGEFNESSAPYWKNEKYSWVLSENEIKYFEQNYYPPNLKNKTDSISIWLSPLPWKPWENLSTIKEKN